LVNSADLKPNGRMVECVNCNHQWYQELNETENFSSALISKKQNNSNNEKINKRKDTNNQMIKNLPSTVVRQEKPSIANSIIIVFLVTLIFLGVWVLRSFGVNTFVLIDFYIKEFFFNLNLIISDLAKIIYDILN
tara:strand:+ start:76 stop:480 length:405 start_codon:yes stop_codon:yes gene_type:complete